MAFRGHFEHALDAKNRLNVPARVRAAFSAGLVLAQGLEPCVTIWVPEAFEAWTQSFLADLSLGVKKTAVNDAKALSHSSFDALSAATRSAFDVLDAAPPDFCSPLTAEHAPI